MATTAPFRDDPTRRASEGGSSSHVPSGTRSRTWRVADWTIRGLLGLAFIGAGAAKLAGVPETTAVFAALDARFGTGMWFLYLTAALEITGGLFILIPNRARLAALLLAAISLGALVTNLFLVPSSPVAATALLALSLVVLWMRPPRRT